MNGYHTTDTMPTHTQVHEKVGVLFVLNTHHHHGSSAHPSSISGNPLLCKYIHIFFSPQPNHELMRLKITSLHGWTLFILFLSHFEVCHIREEHILLAMICRYGPQLHLGGGFSCLPADSCHFSQLSPGTDCTTFPLLTSLGEAATNGSQQQTRDGKSHPFPCQKEGTMS